MAFLDKAGLTRFKEKLDVLFAGKKNTQSAVSDPTASGTATQFISGITQNAQGVISPSKASLPTASTSGAGIVQLNDALTSTSTSQALTANQGKVLEDTKAPKASPVFTGSITLGRVADSTIGDRSFAVGISVKASGQCSHGEGVLTEAIGERSHAEGDSSKAAGFNSHAEGEATYARNRNQHVFGAYNVTDTGSSSNSSNRGNYIEIVGNGDESARSNARALDWSGNERLKGQLYVGCNADSSGGTQVLTKGATWGAIAGISGY